MRITFLSLILIILYSVSQTESNNGLDIGTKGNYKYETVIHASLLFYEAQRSGKLPKTNRVNWRGDSMMDDGKDVVHDLTGGYYDAGDFVKFGFPMAYTITVLTWSLIDYEQAYAKAGELDNMRSAIRWGTDYFIKCHTSDNELYGQVGNGQDDHNYWGRPEDWPKNKVRPSQKVTSAHGGSDLAGDTASALAAASIAFKKSDPAYSEKLLTHAKSLYNFADKHRETYTVEIPDAVNYYKSFSGYGDELALAAAWLFKATNDKHYKSEVEKHFKEFHSLLAGNPGGMGWDNKVGLVQILMAEITREQTYMNMVKYLTDYIVTVKKTPKGLAFMGDWGSLRSVSNCAFMCMQAAKLGINVAQNEKWAESQIGYILGDTGRSFVVGVGVNPPINPHHRSSSCPNPPQKCAFSNPGPNPHTLTGALVGGPDKNDGYNDTRGDYVHNEVAMDYNAGFQSAVAALAHLKNK